MALRLLEQARQPWVLSPTEGPQTSASTNFLGIRQEPVLGLLSASSFSAEENRALVHRTWGLLNSTSYGYGSNFQYNEYDKVSSAAIGLFHMVSAVLLDAMLKFRPVRSIAKVFIIAPGEGPDVEKTRHSRVKFEAVAIANSNDGGDPPRAYASFLYLSGAYHTTALFLAQGAASLLYTRSLEGQVVGGCLTLAFLGADLIERVQETGAGFKVDLI
ncbi:hypothetical protein F4818DRAFT_82855 [Hypoxylon cercidicola]|nr:hypothetical protein F4818DRAFT_82855 [Hypoxylon cercidicola]